MFPDELTLARLYMFWVGVREDAGLPGLRIHDARHTWASQGIMNGIELTTVGQLLGHRRRTTTAIYAHLDDASLQVAAAQAAAVIARAMGYKAEPPPLTEEPGDGGGRSMRWFDWDVARPAPPGPRTARDQASDPLNWTETKEGMGDSVRHEARDCPVGTSPPSSPGEAAKDTGRPARQI